MSRDLAEIVQDLRIQLAKRGDASINTLARAFQVNDHDRSGYFDFQEFETIMSRVGLFLKRQELTALFRHFDVNQDKRINYAEFLKGVQGQMNGRRVGIVRQAFQKMDRDGSGLIDSKDVTGLYNAATHPKVLSGEKTETQILNEFLMAFEGAGGNNDGKVSFDEFLDYYSGISASIPYDDEYFATVLERAWGIKEDESALDDIPPSLLAKIENVIREKVRQKTRSGKPEAATLKSHFNFFDIDNSGTIIFDEFISALRRLGVVLDENVARALFRGFDANDNGRISYQEFVGRLYQMGNPSDSKLASTSVVPGETQYLDGGTMLVSAGTATGNAPKLVKVLFLMGGPCSGKSTQAARLTTEFNFVHLDVAYLLQVEVEQGTSAESEELRQAVSQGQAVSSDVTVALIKQAIESNVEQGKNFFVLDGFPRSPENIQAWQRQCSAYDVPAVIFLDAPIEILERRGGRDNPDLGGRLQQFEQVTMPLVAYFADARKLRAVSAVAQPELVYESVRKVVRSL